jgi:hypothetical protein
MPYWKDSKNTKHKRCPRRPILEDPRWWATIVTALNNYEGGFLPHDGGMNAQNAMFSDVIYFTKQYLDYYANVASGNEETTRTKARIVNDDEDWA